MAYYKTIPTHSLDLLSIWTHMSNTAAIAWHENRERWTGDKSQQSRKISKDQVISWSTTYEELLLTSEPFSQPIPLPEIVDFLVDIWHDDGLFD
ncbi:uncharacterized protein LOC120132341 isoform X2 [Hibiscus syriacus]|uniref:uncharacterized protein LOC120132341 isoform X2 n=1 Tax=Hibiscus syriacus TaxID=106335 RepID=UPI0019246D9C|nr:uncharacterized protein LOC120132341 isoform X2 [Hibiscus syriacus]